MSRSVALCLLVIMLAICNVGYSISALPSYNIFYMPTKDGKSLQPYIELYWQVDPKSIHYAEDGEGIWRTKIKTEVKIYTDTKEIATDKYYLQTARAASLRAAWAQNIMDIHRYIVPAGKVYIQVRLLEDDYTKEVFTYTDSVSTTTATETIYSQLQLLDTSYQSDITNNNFLKNGNLQIPLCFDFLDDYRNTLNYYFELYNADNIAAEGLPLTQEVFISKKELAFDIYNLTHTDTLHTTEQIIPLLGRFNIDVLPSGNYYLNVVLKNNKGQKLTQQTLFFQQSNPTPAKFSPNGNDSTSADSTDPVFEKVNLFAVDETFVGEYKPAQLKAILKMLKPIATEAELLNIEAFAEKPEMTYIKYFIYNFWKSHSPLDPEQGWKDYTKLVRNVNDLFGSKSKPGYETERGFYYLKYGPPDLRMVATAEEGAWPYEVWQYNAPGKQSSAGAFLFYNPGFMVNDYMLLHSTVQGEMRNTAWRAQLYRTGRTTSQNSRAEQIFSNQ